MRIVRWAPVSETDPPRSFGAAFMAHIGAIRAPTARASSVSAWALLYKTLTERGLPVGRVAFGPHGKPFFEDVDVQFSVTHAGSIVAVSVSDRPTGVDVESCAREVRPRLLARCLSEDEKRDFDGDFIRLWCRKECVVKLTGEGLRGYPDGVDAFDPGIDFEESVIARPDGDYRLTAAFLK